jgi:DNA-binding response OmpR family regulator
MWFTFTEAKQNMTSSDLEKKRILFVDDDMEAQELVTLTLALTGYGIVIARDFNEGLNLARRQYFDLYILDNWLPDGSGVELCRRIREFDQHTPILFYSGAGYKRDTQDAIGSGAQEYLIKPVSSEELKRAVARLVSRIQPC